MTDIATADAAQIAAPHSSEHDRFPPQNAYNPVPSSVEFDVDYSQGVEFVIRIGSPTNIRLIFKDQRGSPISRPTSGGVVLNDSPATLTSTLSGDGQSVLIAPKALGSTIVSYVSCSCLTASMIVRVTNRVGPLRPHRSVQISVLDYLRAINADYQPRTIDDIIGYVQADRRSIESALEHLVENGFIRQSGEFWQPLNPVSASDLR
jgi:hypothetical protein